MNNNMTSPCRLPAPASKHPFNHSESEFVQARPQIDLLLIRGPCVNLVAAIKESVYLYWKQLDSLAGVPSHNCSL